MLTDQGQAQLLSFKSFPVCMQPVHILNIKKEYSLPSSEYTLSQLVFGEEYLLFCTIRYECHHSLPRLS